MVKNKLMSGLTSTYTAWVDENIYLRILSYMVL